MSLLSKLLLSLLAVSLFFLVGTYRQTIITWVQEFLAFVR